LWTSHFLEVAGNGNARLIDARTAGGQVLTQNGTYGFGATFFGNCCRRVYDLNYDTNAPFAALNLQLGGVTIDGSARWDFGNASGQTFGSDLGGGRVGVTSRDVDGNGTITAAEAQTSVVPLTNPSPVDYNYDYASYSLGLNYKLADDLAVFARYSKGGRANADRLLFNNNNVNTTTGALQSNDVAVDFVTQLEGGAKYRSGNASLFGTLFFARTQEQNFEATTQRTFDRAYKAYGIELEGSYRIGGFSLRAGATYTDAEISRDNQNAAVVGNTPRRQAKFVYQVTPQYETDMFTVGANVIGTTSSFAQDDNQLKLPAFTQVNAFLSVRPIDRVQLSVNANNLFDVRGFTESEEGSIPANGIIRARSINGRTISAAVKFEF
jgi:outer membrane receptor protein involved in Fe transport